MIPMDKLSSYVKEHGGDIAISKILMASNGLAAVKGMRSIRNWVYETFGDESLINFVAMATKDDLEANAEFVKLADELIEVSGGPNNFNYANVDLIVSLAKKHNVHVRALDIVEINFQPNAILFRLFGQDGDTPRKIHDCLIFWPNWTRLSCSLDLQADL